MPRQPAGFHVVRFVPVFAALFAEPAAAQSAAQPTTPTRPGVARTTSGTSTADSVDVAAAVDRYHRALAAGDSATALALLAPDVVVLEGGGAETLAEYRSHHLAGDIGFARASRRTRSPHRIVVRGDAGWATSTSTVTGSYRGQAVNSAGAEIMVLSREPGGWKIRAIHWSSRARRGAP